MTAVSERHTGIHTQAYIHRCGGAERGRDEVAHCSAVSASKMWPKLCRSMVYSSEGLQPCPTVVRHTPPGSRSLSSWPLNQSFHLLNNTSMKLAAGGETREREHVPPTGCLIPCQRLCECLVEPVQNGLVRNGHRHQVHQHHEAIHEAGWYAA